MNEGSEITYKSRPYSNNSIHKVQLKIPTEQYISYVKQKVELIYIALLNQVLCPLVEDDHIQGA